MQHNRSHRAGFTLTEIATALFLMGIVAIFVVPKLMHPQEDRQANALIRDSFTTIGEMYLSRKTNPNYPAEDIGGSERNTFGQYLFGHINYHKVIDPATPIGADAYCTTADNYFVLPLDVTIRKICDDNTTTPHTLKVTVQVPKLNGPISRDGQKWVEYTLVIPEDEERYTTLYGFTGINTDCNPDVDPILKTVETQCP